MKYYSVTYGDVTYLVQYSPYTEDVREVGSLWGAGEWTTEDAELQVKLDMNNIIEHEYAVEYECDIDDIEIVNNPIFSPNSVFIDIPL